MNPADFPAKMADIRLAMENEEWARAMRELENLGDLPEKFVGAASGILFYLYVSRNQYEKLARLGPRLDPAKSKDAVAALLLLRNQALDYPVDLPSAWKIEEWEQAIENHARAERLDPAELSLCLHFLSLLNRPRLLEILHAQSVAAGAGLNDESISLVLRCYLRNGWFEQARRFLWAHTLNGIAFDRFSFLIDRAEKGATKIPESTDKFLTFLHHRFGTDLPATKPDLTTPN
jgi:hypothetical protein